MFGLRSVLANLFCCCGKSRQEDVVGIEFAGPRAASAYAGDVLGAQRDELSAFQAAQLTLRVQEPV